VQMRGVALVFASAICCVLAQPAIPEALTPAAPTSATGASANVTGWNVDEARRFWQLSNAAYCPTNVLKTWKCKYCVGNATLVDTVYDQRTNTFGYCAYDRSRNEVFLSFRGTVPTSIKNWIEDLKFWKADTPFDGLANAKVAKGFNECYRALSVGATRCVRSALEILPTARLVITGHSLGGALATLATLDMKVVQNLKGDIYTYGSPRVGNNGFADHFAAHLRGAQQWRLVNDRDIVPHVPPHAFDFQHVDLEVWEHGAQYKVCNPGKEDPTCSASVILPILPDSIWDHLHYMQIEGGLCFGEMGEIIENGLEHELPH